MTLKLKQEQSSLYSGESKLSAPLLFVLVIATAAIAWFGSALVPSSVNNLSLSLTYPNLSGKSKKELIELGNDLQEQKCAGCHAISETLVGPSYKDILESCQHLSLLDMGEGTEEQKMATISAGIEHPQNDKWQNYPRGPSMRPARDELTALTTWILNCQSQNEENNRTEGAESSPQTSGSQER